jgi:hypothetical protein
MMWSILEMNGLELISMPMKSHKQAGIIERRAKMRKHIERELPCATTGYERYVDH